MDLSLTYGDIGAELHLDLTEASLCIAGLAMVAVALLMLYRMCTTPDAKRSPFAAVRDVINAR